MAVIRDYPQESRIYRTDTIVGSILDITHNRLPSGEALM
jgi:hypothetical protein